MCAKGSDRAGLPARGQERAVLPSGSAFLVPASGDAMCGGGVADLKNDLRSLWPPMIHTDTEGHGNNQGHKGNP